MPTILLLLVGVLQPNHQSPCLFLEKGGRMSTSVAPKAKRGSKVAQKTGNGHVPRSLKIAEKGIKTGHDFANLMSALMSDLIEGRVAPNVGNATSNAGGKLLKVVEMQYKYGTVSPGKESKTLVLAIGNSEK